MALDFEWAPAKAKLNLKEHGVSFDEASTVFRDTLSITIVDPDHSDSEQRFVDIGMSHRGRLLVVSHRAPRQDSHHKRKASDTIRAEEL